MSKSGRSTCNRIMEKRSGVRIYRVSERDARIWVAVACNVKETRWDGITLP